MWLVKMLLKMIQTQVNKTVLKCWGGGQDTPWIGLPPHHNNIIKKQTTFHTHIHS